MTRILITEYHEWCNNIAHDVLKLFFECKEHNIATNETIALLNEFLYPDYDRLNPLYEEYYSKLDESIDKNNAERIIKYFSKIYTELQDISYFIPKYIQPVLRHRDKRLECDNQKNFQNELNFNVAEICYIRAMESYKNSYSKRINYYTKAIEEDPEWAECYSERAYCYDRERDYESAMVDYQKALELFKKQDDEENCNLMEQKIKELESKTQC